MPYIVKDKIAFLSEASKILSSTLDYNVTLASIANLVVNNVADFCLIDIMEEDGLQRVVVRVSDPKKQTLANKMYDFLPDPNNKMAIYDAAKRGSPIVIKKVTKEWLRSVSKIKEERELVGLLNQRSFIFAPMKSRGEVIGVMTISSSEENFSYSQDDAVFIEELANRAAIAVDKARLYMEAQEALRIRDEFLSIASHELKTPLTSILLNLQLILRKIKNSPPGELDTKKITEMIELSEKQSTRLARLINDLLNVSIVSTGRLQIEREKVNLNNLVADIINRFSLELEKANAKISIKAEKNIIGNWDNIRIEQVISNLISNAIKYGAGDPITVQLEKEGKTAIIRVKDRGIGIKEEDLPEVFKRFKRGTLSKKYHGFGVGMYLSRQIVDAHGGEINVKSKLGKGSTFSVILPLN
jgi:signal transduction histidine kinase